MATLYGEGEHAFRRLQEEIVQRVPDQSLFSWEDLYMDVEGSQDLAQCLSLKNATFLGCVKAKPSRQSLFASSPEVFSLAGKIRAVSREDILHRLPLPYIPASQYTFTPYGIQTQLPVIPLGHSLPQHVLAYHPQEPARWYLAILGCEHEDFPGALLGRIIYISPSTSDIEYLHCGKMAIRPVPTFGTRLYGPELFPLSPSFVDRCGEYIELKTVYISHPERVSIQSNRARYQPHKTVNLRLQRNERDALLTQGYTAGLQGPDEGQQTTHWLTLSCVDHTITLEYQHTLTRDGRGLGIRASAKLSRQLLDSAEEILAKPSYVKWRDNTFHEAWSASLGARDVVFTLGSAKLFLKLGLDWMAPSAYSVHLEIVMEELSTTAAVPLESIQGEEHLVLNTSDRADERDRGRDERARYSGTEKWHA